MLDSSTIDGGKTGICYQELGADSHNLMGYRMATESIALQISEWLKNCASLHKSCNDQQRNQDSTSAKIRLLVDANISGQESDIRYVTLSHRWSNITKAGATTKATILERYQSLSLDEFPSHFKEAIALIRRLGFEHIWIDSLCIIQDSQDDWLQQASLMQRIYSRGVLNLAPLGELSNSDDVRPSKNTEVMGCILRVSDDDAASESLICWKPDNFDQTLRESVLYSRGWTFQERLLSTRTVHFGHQQYWECCSLRASTTFPTGVDFPGTFSDNFVLRFKELSPDLPNKRMGAQDLHVLWCSLVRDYSRKTFTRSSDKLVAFRGIVERLEQVFPPALHEYMHGLWSSCLPEQLLWGVEEDCNRGASCTTVLPSWSWASRTQETKFVSTHLEQVPFRIRLAHFVGACTVSLEKYCASEGVVQMDARPSLKFNGILVSLSSMDRRTLSTEFDSDSCFAEEPSIFLFPAFQTMTRVDGLILQPIEIGDGVTGCGTYFQRLGIFQSPTNIFEKVIPMLFGRLLPDGSIEADSGNDLYLEHLEAEKQVDERVQDVPGVARWILCANNGVFLEHYEN
ncbi:uncharacterized protein RHO25_011709 [Cercospora beticola]|uniref:Heterokaryon incompatibility domain-containing protein n=1 Tax=Cercospora beticola TaxID=122368 RepID=A0ABZ0P5A9_CERBT|nr:hypothetical protein RHO25_011709 [Cercospora beticola]